MSQEMVLRLGFFVVVFLFSAAWELSAPRRAFVVPRLWRWAANLGILLLDTLLVRLALPLLAIDMAKTAQAHGWGLLNLVRWPFGIEILLAFICLDFTIYLQHRFFHMNPVLWRLHKVHHTDLDLDATTGVRFHPLEILVSMAIKLAAVALLGAQALAVLAFEIALNATSLFNHANILIPEPMERALRLFLVTPDMHRVHHSTGIGETNSNFGFNLPWWDRLLGTYHGQPSEGHRGMTIGLPEYQDWREQSLPWLVTLPLRKPSRP
jgi:sterol desaturase/sphingolipid hydroxylase (fatty acid hydroxylase superfamily)